MNVLNLEHISKLYGDKLIFDDISCGIQEGEKIGIIGINGTGKSTFLKMIAGEETPDSGQVISQNGIRMAYLPQNPDFPENQTVLAYVLEGASADAWDTESEAKSMLNQLGMSQFDAQLQHLSGGQRKRAALAKTLMSSFEVLILDEPTNHLDEEMVNWLEGYLQKTKATIIMVTHDRYFLDQVTNRILEISHGNLYSYQANYSQFLEMKAQREEMELASERKRQSILRMELEWAKRGCRARTTKQKARLERLEALKNGKSPLDDQTIEVNAATSRMGKKTIELQHVSKAYDGQVLVEDFDYIVLRGERLGIIGPNGCGKSTLMNLLAGELEPDAGTIELGETIKVGYFAQDEREMDGKQRVIDYIKDIAEYITVQDGKVSASQFLEQFLFSPELQYTPIEKLSGGERRRLYLLSILAGGANVLLFDEPSNNLDIPTLTILEDYLNSFPGIVITVSHDRYFLDNVVNRIFAFEGDGKLQQYEGGYTDYLEAKERRTTSAAENQSNSNSKSGKSQDTKKGPDKEKTTGKQKLNQKAKFSYNEQREFETIDDDIAAIEESIAKIDGQIEANATNSMKLSQLMEEKASLEASLEEKTERWVYLNDLYEQIQNS